MSPGSLPPGRLGILSQAGGVRDAATPSDQLRIAAAGEGGRRLGCPAKSTLPLMLSKSGDIFKINLLNDITIILICLDVT